MIDCILLEKEVIVFSDVNVFYLWIYELVLEEGRVLLEEV